MTQHASGSKDCGPSTPGAVNTTRQHGSAHGGKEGEQGSDNDNEGNSRDSNKPDNKTAQKNNDAGK
jgi:hypothetical protein